MPLNTPVPLKEYFQPKALKKRFSEKIEKSKVSGSDGVSAKQFKSLLNDETDIIQRKVENMTYRFSRFNEKLIIKDSKSPPRAVYIPTVRDRLVLSTLNSYLNDVFYEDFKKYSLTVDKNISEIISIIESNKYNAFIKIDVKNFFPSLDHEVLLSKIKENIQDKAIISLLKKVLNRSKLDMDSCSGIAQGLSISGQLAEVYLNDLDRKFKNQSKFKYFRYVDDILILCCKSDTDSINSEIKQDFENLKLILHAKKIGGKSEIGILGQDKLEYLGFVFHGSKISVREKSIEKLRQKIRSEILELKNTNCLSNELTEKNYFKLNLKITGFLSAKNKPYGWLFFFRRINDLTLLNHLDWFVKKTFKDCQLEYDNKKIKSFVKSYFKIKSLNPSKLNKKTYIPRFLKEKELSEEEFKLVIDDLF